MFLEKKEGMVESGVADERKKPVGGTLQVKVSETW